MTAAGPAGPGRESDVDRCEECGCRIDRPSRYACTDAPHPPAGPALLAAFAVRSELSDRRIRWDDVDDDLCDEIDDALAARIEAAYTPGGGPPAASR